MEPVVELLCRASTSGLSPGFFFGTSILTSETANTTIQPHTRETNNVAFAPSGNSDEPRHKKTGSLHMQKQRRRSDSR